VKLHPDNDAIFEYYSPKEHTDYKGLISVPHSGMMVPQEFKHWLVDDPLIHQCDIDFKVNKLINIERLNESGIGVLVSNISRACVDLNRAGHNSVLTWKNNTKGERIVFEEPPAKLYAEFQKKYWAPYYEVLKNTIKELEPRKKQLVSFIDLHSMPSTPTDYHMQQYPGQDTHRPDFCISDLNETSCEANYIFYIQNHLSIKGHEVKINNPYYGGHVSQYCSQFNSNVVQIEVNRSIYMDEKKQELIPDKVKILKKDLTEVLIGLFTQFNS
jgi:N-formylglutamate amidohydrolase